MDNADIRDRLGFRPNIFSDLSSVTTLYNRSYLMSIAVQFEYAHALEALLDEDEHYFTATLLKYVRRSRLIHGGICGSGNAWKDSQRPFFTE